MKMTARIAATVSGAGLLFATTMASAGDGMGITIAYQVSVPEPSALSLMAGGVATAILLARAKRKK